MLKLGGEEEPETKDDGDGEAETCFHPLREWQSSDESAKDPQEQNNAKESPQSLWIGADQASPQHPWSQEVHGSAIWLLSISLSNQWDSQEETGQGVFVTEGGRVEWAPALTTESG